MSVNYNKVIIAGNLTRNPDVKFLPNERAVANFAVAVNRRWKDANGTTQEETTFVDIEAWGRTAELVGQYLTKGRSALVEGRLKLDEWDDKASGQKRTRLKVVADIVQFIGSNDKTTGPVAAEGVSIPGQQEHSAPDDEEPPW